MLKKIWSIGKNDLGKFLPIFLMGLLICFNYALLRVLKDAVVIPASNAGAGVIPFLKMWGVLPGALIATVVMSILFRKLRRDQVFYWVIGGFLAYFLLFGTLIYPLREQFALDRLATYLHAHLPAGFSAPIEIIKDWPLSLFYVMCELWKVIALNVIFWGFINANSNLDEAQRFYAPLMVGGSIAGILAGFLTQIMSHRLADNWEGTLSLYLTITTVVGLAIIALYAYVRRGKKELQTVERENSSKSVFDAFRSVIKSPILLCMSAVIIADYIAFNVVETLWKEQVRILFPTSAGFCAYTGKVAIWTGILGVAGSLFISGRLVRISGWTAIAIAMPIIVLVTSAGFFGFLLIGGAQFAVWTAFCGAAHNCLCRAARQAFHSPAKEIVYLHLSSDLQTQGKTFVDGMTPTIGKSGGSLLQQGLLLTSPTILGTASLSSVIVFGSLLAAITLTVRAGNLLRRSPATSRA